MNIEYNILTIDEPTLVILNLADAGECCTACRESAVCIRYEYLSAAPGFNSTCDLFVTDFTGPTFAGTATRGDGARFSEHAHVACRRKCPPMMIQRLDDIATTSALQ